MRKRIYKIIESGKKVRGIFFDVYYKERDEYKTGFIVSSKIGRATKRNYVKRIIREIWRENFKNGDFVFILKLSAIDKNKQEIINEAKRMVKFLK